jgi:hypothetical protein
MNMGSLHPDDAVGKVMSRWTGRLRVALSYRAFCFASWLAPADLHVNGGSLATVAAMVDYARNVWPSEQGSPLAHEEAPGEASGGPAAGPGSVVAPADPAPASARQVAPPGALPRDTAPNVPAAPYAPDPAPAAPAAPAAAADTTSAGAGPAQ